MFFATDKFGPKESFQICQGRTSQKGTIRNASQKRNAPRLHHGLGQVVFGLFVLVGYDFVNNDAGNSNIVVLAQDSIQFEFVKRFSETTIGTSGTVQYIQERKKKKMCQRQRLT
jgi:hypothetical protein